MVSAKNDFNLTDLSSLPSNRRASAKVETPSQAITPERAQRFVDAAKTHSLPGKNNKYPDWESHDPNAPFVTGINVRLNHYQMGLLHEVARLDDRKVLNVMRRLLIPAAEAELQRLKGE